MAEQQLHQQQLKALHEDLEALQVCMCLLASSIAACARARSVLGVRALVLGLC